MENDQQRREPQLPESGSQANEPDFSERDSASNGNPALRVDGATKLLLLLIALIGLLFLAERMYAWYIARQALQQLTEISVDAQREMQSTLSEISQQQQTRAASLQRQNEERIELQRKERAATATGYWLRKNCSDWQNAWQELGAETAKQEMEKHCDRYRRYLETGIAPAGAPRPSQP